MKQAVFLVGLLVGIVLAFSSSLLAQSDRGGLSGQDWNNMPDDWRLMAAAFYHRGVVQGMFMQAVRPVQAKTVMMCQHEGKWSGTQVQAIVDKYVRDNPQHWQRSIADLMWDAFVAACKK